MRRIHNGAHNQTEYPCNFCAKVFAVRANLISHMHSHHGLKITFPSETEKVEENPNAFGQNVDAIDNSVTIQVV